MGPDAMILVSLMLSFKPAFFHSPRFPLSSYLLSDGQYLEPSYMCFYFIVLEMCLKNQNFFQNQQHVFSNFFFLFQFFFVVFFFVYCTSASRHYNIHSTSILCVLIETQQTQNAVAYVKSCVTKPRLDLITVSALQEVESQTNQSRMIDWIRHQ